MKTYREYIIKTLEVLEDSHGQICAELLNLASTGEMEHVMSAFETGDSYEFELAHFESCEDPNIQKLIALLKVIDNSFQAIMKSNNILSEEVNPQNYNEDYD